MWQVSWQVKVPLMTIACLISCTQNLMTRLSHFLIRVIGCDSGILTLSSPFACNILQLCFCQKFKYFRVYQRAHKGKKSRVMRSVPSWNCSSLLPVNQSTAVQLATGRLLQFPMIWALFLTCSRYSVENSIGVPWALTRFRPTWRSLL